MKEGCRWGIVSVVALGVNNASFEGGFEYLLHPWIDDVRYVARISSAAMQVCPDANLVEVRGSVKALFVLNLWETSFFSHCS